MDDERDLIDVLAEVLGAAGFAVTVASDGRSALEAFGRGHFDAVVTDLKMPGMDGLELMAALRALEPALPVIVITGYASENARLTLEAREAHAVLLKPFTFDELRSELERAVRVSRSPRESLVAGAPS